MKPCKKCGDTKSLEDYYKTKGTKDGRQATCKECVKGRTKKYREENPDKVREAKRKSEAKNPEKYSEYKRGWYESNRDETLATMRESHLKNAEEKREYDRNYREANRDSIAIKKRGYYDTNPELFAYHRRLRKARERDSVIDFTPEEYTELMERFDWKCCLTGSTDIHLDHFIPVCTRFGPTSITNLIPLDASLNKSKGGRNPFEWIKTQSHEIKTKFNEVVEYLADLNGFAKEEYEAHVYNCFDK